MRTLTSFYVAQVHGIDGLGNSRVKYTKGGFEDAQGALGDAEDHVQLGTHYEVRLVTRNAWDEWSRNSHGLPVRGEIVAGGFQLPIAS